MTVNKRVDVPADRAPFTAVAFTSNDKINHRISFFEAPHATIDSERSRRARVQHIAFAYGTLDDLLGTYVLLAKLGMTPMWAADQWSQTAIYYEDPDKNIIEVNVDNFANLWAVTEGLGASLAKPDRGRRQGRQTPSGGQPQRNRGCYRGLRQASRPNWTTPQRRRFLGRRVGLARLVTQRPDARSPHAATRGAIVPA